MSGAAEYCNRPRHLIEMQLKRGSEVVQSGAQDVRKDARASAARILRGAWASECPDVGTNPDNSV
jgi:hypothetical protein